MTRYAALFHPDPTLQPALLASLNNLVARISIVNEVTLSLNLDSLTSNQTSEPEVIRTIGRHLYETTAMSVQIGIANTLFVATLAALQPRRATFINNDETFLADHPIEILAAGLDLELLHRLGITTVRHFQALDPLLVRDRFGPLGTFAHQIARGHDPISATPFAPKEPFLAERTLETPLVTQEPIIFLANELAHSLTELLHQRDRTCMAFVLHALHGSGTRQEQTFTLTHPWCEEEIWPRIQTTIEGWVQKSMPPGNAPPADTIWDPDYHGITKLTIAARQILPRSGLPLHLWGTSPTRNARIVGATSRIAALLRDQNTPVLRALLRPGRTYAERSTWVPFDAADKDRQVFSASPTSSAPWPGALPAPHPASVFSSPQSVELRDAQHQSISVSANANLSANPALVTLEGRHHKVSNWAGPWPLEQHWWYHDGGDRLAHLQITTDESAYLLAAQEQRWWLVGRYD